MLILSFICREIVKPEQKRKRSPLSEEEAREKRQMKKERAIEERRRKTKKKEEKLELAREIMGIPADSLRLAAYTTATGTLLELAHNLQHLQVRSPPGRRMRRKHSKKKNNFELPQEHDSETIANLVAKVENSIDLSKFNVTLTRLKATQEALERMDFYENK